MAKRGIILLAIAILAILGGMLFVVFGPEPEPSYKGKTLTEWLLNDEWSLGADTNRTEAVRHIGTKAIPFALLWIRYEGPPKWKVRLNSFSASYLGYNGFLQQSRAAVLRADNTVQAFEALGPEAKGAIPELIMLMNTSTGRFTGFRAACSLAAIGRDALPPLIATLTNRQSKARGYAFFAVGCMGTNALPALPFLIQGLADKDELIATSAIEALGSLNLQPMLVVPALTNVLVDTRPAIRKATVNVLAQFGSAARFAMPSMQFLLVDPDAEVREAATNAFLQIDPEALKRATGGLPP